MDAPVIDMTVEDTDFDPIPDEDALQATEPEPEPVAAPEPEAANVPDLVPEAQVATGKQHESAEEMVEEDTQEVKEEEKVEDMQVDDTPQPVSEPQAASVVVEEAPKVGEGDKGEETQLQQKVIGQNSNTEAIAAPAADTPPSAKEEEIVQKVMSEEQGDSAEPARKRRMVDAANPTMSPEMIAALASLGPVLPQGKPSQGDATTTKIYVTTLVEGATEETVRNLFPAEIQSGIAVVSMRDPKEFVPSKAKDGTTSGGAAWVDFKDVETSAKAFTHIRNNHPGHGVAFTRPIRTYDGAVFPCEHKQWADWRRVRQKGGVQHFLCVKCGVKMRFAVDGRIRHSAGACEGEGSGQERGGRGGSVDQQQHQQSGQGGRHRVQLRSNQEPMSVAQRRRMQPQVQPQPPPPPPTYQQGVGGGYGDGHHGVYQGQSNAHPYQAYGNGQGSGSWGGASHQQQDGTYHLQRWDSSQGYYDVVPIAEQTYDPYGSGGPPGGFQLGSSRVVTSQISAPNGRALPPSKGGKDYYNDHWRGGTAAYVPYGVYDEFNYDRSQTQPSHHAQPQPQYPTTENLACRQEERGRGQKRRRSRSHSRSRSYSPEPRAVESRISRDEPRRRHEVVKT